MNPVSPRHEEPDFSDVSGSSFRPILGRRSWLIGGALSALGAVGGSYYYWHIDRAPHLVFDGQYAHAGPELPPVIHAIVQYANELQSLPHERGGGHRVLFDDGFDCSGAISHILIRANLLRSPLTSSGFASYGLQGAGRFVTLFVRPGSHVFMTVCGLRFDNSGGSQGEGPRWRPTPRDPHGFIIRHPVNL